MAKQTQGKKQEGPQNFNMNADLQFKQLRNPDLELPVFSFGETQEDIDNRAEQMGIEEKWHKLTLPWPVNSPLAGRFEYALELNSGAKFAVFGEIDKRGEATGRRFRAWTPALLFAILSTQAEAGQILRVTPRPKKKTIIDGEERMTWQVDVESVPASTH